MVDRKNRSVQVAQSSKHLREHLVPCGARDVGYEGAQGRLSCPDGAAASVGGGLGRSVTEDAEIIMFSPQREHTHVIDHMRNKVKAMEAEQK